VFQAVNGECTKDEDDLDRSWGWWLRDSGQKVYLLPESIVPEGAELTFKTK
jgi:hypothetical protein